MIQLMSHNSPQIEKTVTWGFTVEEIQHRWKIFMQFDPITRLFGNKSGDKNDTSPPPKINPPEAFQALQRMFGIVTEE